MKSRQASPAADSSEPPPILVSFPGQSLPLRFTAHFRIGRTSACEVCIVNDFVSRLHAEVTPLAEGWQIRDLQSSNGIYIDGNRVQTAILSDRQTIRLGAEGPELCFEIRPQRSEVLAPQTFGDATVVARNAERFLREPSPGEALGEHTQFIRALVNVQTQNEAVYKKSRARRTVVFASIVAALLLAASLVSWYALRLRDENERHREAALEIFYQIKVLDVEIAQAEQTALAVDSRHGAEVVDKYEARREQMRKNYDRIVLSLSTNRQTQGTEQHRLIVRVAGILGECELDIPAGFEQEVMRYIHLWQQSPRFARDIRLAQQKNYTHSIPQALRRRGLPAQFFYLAMQESDFNPNSVGPPTRSGYAKGMWQFIPDTGVRYGLHLGPFADTNQPDAEDERNQSAKATEAAARYLDKLYSTDAQASALLVMACYNWGENSVLPLVRSMPANPRQRNFWRLLADHRDQIPQETYNYVFMITAAAVIGENPRLFGFDFDNPLTQETAE